MSKLKNVIKYILNPRPKHVLDFSNTAESNPQTLSRFNVNRRFISPSLILGLIIIISLILLVLFGPILASQNPFLNPFHEPFSRYDPETGTIVEPPLPPSREHPLGTDIFGNDYLSWLLFGARTTLILTFLVTLGRMLAGIGLGSVAGWYADRIPDQIVNLIIPVITAVPMLISSAMLIYALGIRHGFTTFIIALTLVGWTEIAQLVRSEVLVIRRLPFIEAARSTGLRKSQIVVRHIWPNIIPRLIVIFFLEMGAVLLLLAELGFLGVFLGGGNQIATGPSATPEAFPDIPDWGLMLFQGTAYLRSKPFVIIGPAVAYFIAIVGFNAFGEGLRQFVARSGANTAFLMNRKFLVVVGLGAVASFLIVNLTGSVYWYRQAAVQFDPSAVSENFSELAQIQSSPPAELPANAVYLAQQFEQLGLEPGWKPAIFEGGFFYQAENGRTHVMALWPGYDFNLSREMVVVFTTYKSSNDSESNMNLAMMISMIELMQAQDINPRRSLLFVAWQEDTAGIDTYFTDRDNFRYLAPSRFGVILSPTLFIQLGTLRTKNRVAMHSNSSEQAANFLGQIANQVNVELLEFSEPDIHNPVPPLPWIYLVWPGIEAITAESDLGSLDSVGKTLTLSLITLARDETAWVDTGIETVEMDPTMVPTPIPTEQSPQEVVAVGLVDIIIPEINSSFTPGYFMQFQGTVFGAPGAYLEGQPYSNANLWLSLRPVGEERQIERVSTRVDNRGGLRFNMTLPNDLEPGTYRLILTLRSDQYHGYPLELVGETELEIMIEPRN